AQARNATPSVVQAGPTSTPSSSTIVKSEPLSCSATGESLVSTIPTFDVDNLPKIDPPKMQLRWRAPKKKAVAPKPSSNLDEDNPYNSAADDNPYTGVSPE